MDSSEIDSETSISSDENLDQGSNIDFKGKLLKNFNVIKEIGRGSYSIVWLAYDITNEKFCAVKVQNPEDLKDGLAEIKVLKKLPEDESLLKIQEYFIKNVGEKKFLCSSYELCCGNLDSIIRKGDFKGGLDLKISKKIFKQIIKGLDIIHNKCNLIHCDIKTDNILLKGQNNKDKFMIDLYKKYNFGERYLEAKKKFWTDSGKNLKNIKKMKSEQKVKIRKVVHQAILDQIDLELKDKNFEDDKLSKDLVESPTITIADFGAACTDDEFYEEDFGTRYYRAPEVILMGEISAKVDVWAAGCILYELITGELLFDPEKDKNKTRDYYHLLEMSKVSGKFEKKFLKSTKYYKNFFDSDYDLKDTEFREYYDWDELLDKIKDPKEKGLIIDLIKKMLVTNPKNRITASEVLKHDWLNNEVVSQI